MHQRPTFCPSRKIDLKLKSSDYLNSSDQENLNERRRFENINTLSAGSSKFVSKSYVNKNISESTGSLNNLNSLINLKSKLNDSNYVNTSCPQSPTIEEPFSPRLDNPLNDINKNKIDYNNNENFNKNKQFVFNNKNNNVKHYSYSLSSTGSKSNNKICQINNKISNRILSRNSSINDGSSIISGIIDPIDLQFETLFMAAKNACFENREQNEMPNPIVANAFTKIGTKMTSLVEQFKESNLNQQVNLIDGMSYLMSKSQSIPYYGTDLINNLGTILRNLGAFDLIVKNFALDNLNTQDNQENQDTKNEVTKNENIKEEKDDDKKLKEAKQYNQEDLKISSAKLLNQCLTHENTSHLIENNYQKLPDLVEFCCKLARNRSNTENEQIGTGILKNLFEYNEDICKEILIKLNAIDTIIFECRTADIQTLRNCVHCLANVVLFGGEECQQKLIEKSLLIWLFPLASHRDLQIKYFALLTMIILVANKEIEGSVVKTGSLELIEPFLLSNSPQEVASLKDNLINNSGFGQSKKWLKKLVAVLESDREEAKNLSAFHFAMESFLKKKLGQQSMFREINAIISLKKVASSPIAIASKFAALCLKCLGESVPHKLSQQVALWTTNDVKEWVKQIDFADYIDKFVKSKVDGDLLLRITETHLENDIDIKNGLLRLRFLRELSNLKKIAEYSNCDNLNIEKILNSIGEDYTQYTYSIIQSGIDLKTMQTCTIEQLKNVCGITNDFHAENIINSFKNNIIAEDMKGPLESIDAFISYRRVGGSQLASLLKVHLSLKGLKVFLDVEKLQAGKFHHNLLTSIKSAKHFILVLTPHSLDRCIDDIECNDWVHKEIVEALQNKCNIIPITYDFEWPNLDKLPEDMKPIIQFNAVTWSHEYQEACVEKLLRFMQEEERNSRKISSSTPTSYSLHGTAQAPNNKSNYRPHGINSQSINNKNIPSFVKT